MQGLGTKKIDTSERLAGIFEYIRSTFQPICHISHSSLTATHLIAGAATHLTAAAATHLIAGAATHITAAAATHLIAGAATHLTAAASISNFNYADLQAFISYKCQLRLCLQRGKVDVENERKLPNLRLS